MDNTITVNDTQAGIYRIRNKVNGKFYIGSTRSFRKRMREHLSCLRNGEHINIHLQRSFDKHGEESFVFEIVEVVNDPSVIESVEQGYLDALQPFNENGVFNICTTATSYSLSGEDHWAFGIPKTEEHKRKISESLKGHRHSEETKKKIGIAVKGKNTGKDHWSYGKERSAEHRRKQSESMKGKLAGAKNPTARKVVQLTKELEFVKSYDTLKEAADEVGSNKGCICTACKNPNRTAKGYRWMYLEEYEAMKALN